jgi:two-component system response regulator NreC
MFRQGVAVVLEASGFEVVGEADDKTAAVSLATALQPDVVVLQQRLRTSDGISTAREIHRVAPYAHSVLIATQDDPALAVEALRAGIHGYLLLSQTMDELVAAVHSVARGAVHLGAGGAPAAIEMLASSRRSNDQLTPREREVLKLIADGRSGRAIAADLGVSLKTVETHRYRIMRKLQLHRSADLIRYAVRHRLILP